MKELKLEELSTRQKLGMTFTAFLNDDERTPEEDAFILELIKNHSLGSVWIHQSRSGVEELPHIQKWIIGGLSESSVDTCLDVLAGEYPAKGVPTYEFELK